MRTSRTQMMNIILQHLCFKNFFKSVPGFFKVCRVEQKLQKFNKNPFLICYISYVDIIIIFFSFLTYHHLPPSYSGTAEGTVMAGSRGHLSPSTGRAPGPDWWDCQPGRYQNWWWRTGPPRARCRWSGRRGAWSRSVVDEAEKNGMWSGVSWRCYGPSHFIFSQRGGLVFCSKSVVYLNKSLKSD